MGHEEKMEREDGSNRERQETDLRRQHVMRFSGLMGHSSGPLPT